MTPLMNSILSNNEHAFLYLYCKAKCSLNNVDLQGNSLLHLAAENNSLNIGLILKHLHSNEVKDELNTSIEKLRKIREKSIELQELGSPRNSPKKAKPKAVFALQLNRVEESESEIDMQSEMGDSEVLFTRNSFFDVNAQNMLGQTPIFKAIINNNFEMFEMLLKSGSDITKKEMMNNESVRDSVFRYCPQKASNSIDSLLAMNLNSTETTPSVLELYRKHEA